MEPESHVKFLRFLHLAGGDGREPEAERVEHLDVGGRARLVPPERTLSSAMTAANEYPRVVR